MATTGAIRQHPRVKAPPGTLVGWQVGSDRYVSHLEDIALGGVFISTPNPAPPDSLIRLIVPSPSGEVRARGVVSRVSPSRGMGVKITAMNPDDRGRLVGLIKPLLERQSG